MKKKSQIKNLQLPMESNQRKIALYLLLSILVLIVLSVIVFFKGKEATKPKVADVVPTATPTPIPGETIMVTIHGFVPEVLTVKRGTWINFYNFSEQLIAVEAKDPAIKQLNLGQIKADDTTTPVQYNNPGTYEYFNSLKPEQKAKIVIQ